MSMETDGACLACQLLAWLLLNSGLSQRQDNPILAEKHQSLIDQNPDWPTVKLVFMFKPLRMARSSFLWLLSHVQDRQEHDLQ
jgi:hypothetical protein